MIARAASTAYHPLPWFIRQIRRGGSLEIRGLGDRWLAGEAVEGVLFARNDSVSVVEGPYTGERGFIVLLTGFRVELASGRGRVRLRQSELQASEPPAPPA